MSFFTTLATATFAAALNQVFAAPVNITATLSNDSGDSCSHEASNHYIIFGVLGVGAAFSLYTLGRAGCESIMNLLCCRKGYSNVNGDEQTDNCATRAGALTTETIECCLPSCCKK